MKSKTLYLIYCIIILILAVTSCRKTQINPGETVYLEWVYENGTTETSIKLVR